MTSPGKPTRLSEVIAPAFFPIHADVRRKGHGEYWLGGGRGSGKSSFASIEMLLMIMRDREINGAVFRKVAATMRESVLEQLLWAADRLGAARLFAPKLSPMELTYLPTGQRILLRGADDPGKAKSIKLSNGHFGCVWFEELSDFRSLDEILSIKASVGRGGTVTAFYTFNPPREPSHWINLESRTGSGRLFHRSDYRDMPPEWLGEGFIWDAERLREKNELMYRSMYLGEAVGAEGQVFTNLDIRRIPEGEMNGIDRFLCGLDFGFAVDPDAFVKIGYDRRRGIIWILDEFYAVRTPMDGLSAEVKARCSASQTVVCDSADPRMIDEMRRRGIAAVGAKKGAGSVERGIRWMQELTSIVIDPERCPNAAREFSGYEYARSASGELLAAYPDRANHTIDAARYALESVSQIRQARAMDKHRLYL